MTCHVHISYLQYGGLLYQKRPSGLLACLFVINAITSATGREGETVTAQEHQPFVPGTMSSQEREPSVPIPTFSSPTSLSLFVINLSLVQTSF